MNVGSEPIPPVSLGTLNKGTRQRHTQWGDQMETQEEMAIHIPKREATGGSKPGHLGRPQTLSLRAKRG